MIHAHYHINYHVLRATEAVRNKQRKQSSSTKKFDQHPALGKSALNTVKCKSTGAQALGLTT